MGDKPKPKWQTWTDLNRKVIAKLADKKQFLPRWKKLCKKHAQPTPTPRRGRKKQKIAMKGGRRTAALNSTVLPSPLLDMLTEKQSTQERGTFSNMCKNWREITYLQSNWQHKTESIDVQADFSKVIPDLKQRKVRYIEMVQEAKCGMQFSYRQLIPLTREKWFQFIAELHEYISGLNLNKGAYLDVADLRDGFKQCPPRNLTMLVLNENGKYDRDTLIEISRACPELRHLEMSSLATELDSEIMTFMGKNMPHMRHLDISGCSGIDDSVALALCENMCGLRELNINRAVITNRGVGHLAKLPRLEELVLDGCGFIDERAIRILSDGVVKLKKMSIDNAVDGDRLCEEIAKSRFKLHHLKMGGNETVGEGKPISDTGIFKLMEGSIEYKSIDIHNPHNVTDRALMRFVMVNINLEDLFVDGQDDMKRLKKLIPCP